MSQSARDWASTDPSKNMTLAEVDHLNNELAAGLCIQLGDRYVRTQYNNIIGEPELRGNNYISPLPVNFFGRLAIPGCEEFNIAQFRSSIRDAAASDDPTGTLVTVLQRLLPQNNAIASMFTRIPAVQAVIASALKAF